MTSKGQQIHYAERMIEGADEVSKDEIDYKALIDESCEWSENKEKIQEKINTLKPDTKEKTRQQVEAEEEKLEKQAEEDFKQFKNEEMQNLVDSHSPSQDADYNIYYEQMHNYIDLVAEEYRDFLILKSRAGLGKSFQSVHRLKEKGLTPGEDFKKIQGFSTPLELHNQLYKHRDKLIILDDLEGVLSNKRAIATLKACTQDRAKGETRTVEWRSNSDDVEAQEFQFTGSIIMCVNELPNNDRFKPISSRAVTYELEFKHEEVADLLIEISKDINHPELDKSERVQVAKWIAESSGEDANLDLRTLKKVLDFKAFSDEMWKEMARPVLNLNEEIMFIKKKFKLGKSKEEIQDMYVDQFNKTDRTFRNKWNKTGLEATA